MGKKTYILFDHDGVLVDTEKWYFEASQMALAETGVLPRLLSAIDSQEPQLSVVWSGFR